MQCKMQHTYKYSINAIQCNTMQCNAIQCNAMQCNAMYVRKSVRPYGMKSVSHFFFFLFFFENTKNDKILLKPGFEPGPLAKMI
jgi:hypothetical protein